MIRIRPYKDSDVDTILLWCQDEKAFYQWTAGILGNYPITQKEFCFIESVMPFTAFDETEKYCILGEEWKRKELIMENR